MGFFSTASTSSKTGFGVGILLRPLLANHVFFHKQLFNRIIFVNMQFANKQKLRFINCYIPSSDVPERKRIQRELTAIINEAISKDFHIILTGNFNADMDRSKNPAGAKEFFTTLQNFHLFDSCSLHYNHDRFKHPTFRSTTSTSRIDFVWASSELAYNFTNLRIEPVLQQVSDHTIVVCSVENFLNVKNNRHNIPRKKIYDYDKMNEELWIKYTTKVDALANSCELCRLTFNTRINQNQLNYY